MDFIFSKRAKITFGILMVIGLIAMIYGYITDVSEHHGRFWSNIFINAFFYFGISMGALFFLALQYVTEASYMIVVKRVLEAMSQFVYVGAAIIVVYLLAGSFHIHHIYHWMDPEVTNINSPHYDAIIDGKSAYLNLPFFWFRTILILGVWCYFTNLFRKRSLLEDREGGTAIHFKNINISAVFIVFFAFSSTVVAWDWIMSIDTHWFSTLFGWYVFSGMWISSMVFLVLVVIFLKGRGYLPAVNHSHIQDIGKWVFAISFLWSYLWFSQFLLIWYANMPEEVVYYIVRIQEFKGLFFGMFLVNLVFPMVILMSRDAKRVIGYLIFVGILIFIGHWVDVYLMVTPGSVKSFHFGFMEIGMALGFLGLFLFVVFRSFAKAPLTVKHHPFLEESKHLHI